MTAVQVHHLTERLIEMEHRLEREADARRKIQAPASPLECSALHCCNPGIPQAKLDQGVLIESELHQKDLGGKWGNHDRKPLSQALVRVKLHQFDMKISELERKLKAKSDEARNLKVRQERMEKQIDDTRATREKTERECHREVQESGPEKLQEKRDVEEKLFTAQTRSKSLEQRCQDTAGLTGDNGDPRVVACGGKELEETLKQERNNEQLLRMEKDLEQRESLLSLGRDHSVPLKGRQQELQARLLEADRNREELQRVREELQMQKQQLQIDECDQKYRNWESQRQEVEQQNERTAQELNIMVQQSQEKVKKRAALEKDLRASFEEKSRLQEELQQQKAPQRWTDHVPTPRRNT
eukprot:Skav205597  [mRNA]  locus=scaffold460:143394:147546:+ [translate_table: standard]